MTSPIAIRGVEQWNRWSTDYSPLLISEDSEGRKSRMPGGIIRLLPFVKYGFIFLALGLLLTDSFRLAFAASPSPVVKARTQSTRGIPAKRHSGI
jgi:hypothetical protein